MPVHTGHRGRTLAPLLSEVGLPFAVYYLLRHFDVSPTWSYAGAAATSAVVLAAGALRRRKLDGVSAFMLAMFGAQLVVSILTNDLRLTVLTDSAASAIGGAAMLLSLTLGRPAYYALALRFGGTTPQSREQIKNRWNTDAGYRRLMRTLTTVTGVVLFAEAGARVVLVLTLQADALTGASRVLQLVTIGALAAWVASYAKRTAGAPA